MKTTTHEINVTPTGFEGILPKYHASMYITRIGGICEPGISEEVVGLDGVDRWMEQNGYRRTSSYGPVCLNGFATAEAELERTSSVDL